MVLKSHEWCLLKALLVVFCRGDGWDGWDRCVEFVNFFPRGEAQGLNFSRRLEAEDLRPVMRLLQEEGKLEARKVGIETGWFVKYADGSRPNHKRQQ